MNVTTAGASPPMVTAEERAATRQPAGDIMFAKLIYQLEKSVDVLDTVRSAAAHNTSRTAKGSGSPPEERVRVDGRGLDLGSEGISPVARSGAGAVTVTVSSEGDAGAVVDADGSDESKSPWAERAHGGTSAPSGFDGGLVEEARIGDRGAMTGLAVAAQALSEAESTAAVANEAPHRTGTGEQRGTAAGAAVRLGATLLRSPREPASDAVVKTISLPQRGTYITVGLPRSDALEVEELRSRIADELARSGLTNYRLVINGEDMKRTTPAGGNHGDR